MVIFLFGCVYRHLKLFGLNIKDEKKGELDAIAVMDPNATTEITIEFELRSSNFLKHNHDPEKCDLIVCWKHDWKNCPTNIDVFDFESIYNQIK